MVYRNDTGRLGCWLHQCVLRNTLAGSKTVVSTSRDDPVGSVYSVSAIYSIALRTQKIKGAGARGCRGPWRLPQVVGALLSLASPVNQKKTKKTDITERKRWCVSNCALLALDPFGTHEHRRRRRHSHLTDTDTAHWICGPHGRLRLCAYMY